jgi:aspartate kinase
MTSIILKFGGASLSEPKSFSMISDIIIKKTRYYKGVVVVVSAMGSMTSELLDLADQVNPNPPKREVDMLISVGERISMALLAMALEKKGVSACSFTGSQSGIITCERHNQAKIIDVKPFRIEEALLDNKVVIVAGFQGVSSSGEITTLGRGGSDTTAVALGVALDSEVVEFYKDVGGIYSRDPKKDPSAFHFEYLTYIQLLEILEHSSQVMHRRSVQLAQENRVKLKILSFLDVKKGTWVYDSFTNYHKNKTYELGKLTYA